MKLNKITYLSIAALMSLASCNDFLDKVPDTRVELNSPEQLKMLLVDGYPSQSYSAVGELSSDNMIDNNSPNEKGVRYNLGEYDRIDNELFSFEDAKSSTGEDTPSGVWESYYHSIACANAVLDRVEYFESQGRADEVAAVKGEALVLRAYDHFILANIFCMPYRGPELSKTIPGIPYMTKPETEVLVQYERGNLADVYAKIQADLEAGLPLINDGLYDVPKYHFNKQAANAFAARFYLFIRDYEKVVKYADIALGGAGANVAQYCTDIWNHSAEFYYISDFARYFTNISQTRNFMLISTYSVFLRHMNSGRYATNRDAKRGTIQGPGPTWSRWMWSNSQTGESFAMHPCFNGVCGSAGKSEYGTYFAGTLGEQFEYTDKLAGIGYAHNVRSEFYGEETIMCRAEAKAYLGDYEGAVADLRAWEETLRNTPNVSGESDLSRFATLTLDLINTFYGTNDPGYGIVKTLNIDEVNPSDKYTVNDANRALLQCVLHFRRIVTVHNGMRFFDIKRYGLEIDHYQGKDNTKYTLTKLDPRSAIQIPAEVISAGLEPNDRVKFTAGDSQKLGVDKSNKLQK